MSQQNEQHIEMNDYYSDGWESIDGWNNGNDEEWSDADDEVTAMIKENEKRKQREKHERRKKLEKIRREQAKQTGDKNNFQIIYDSE